MKAAGPVSCTRIGALALSSAVVLLLPGTGWAQEAQQGEFSAQRLEAAPGPNNIVSVERVRMSQPLGWSVGMLFNYTRDPFVVVSCIAETNCDEPNATNVEDVPIVQNMFWWDLMASFNPVDFVQLGLTIPLAYVTGSGINTDTGVPIAGATDGFGLGDPRLEGKIRFFGDSKSLVALGGAVDIAAGLGHITAEDKFIGNDSPVTIGWRGIADFYYEGFFAAVNLRGIYRGESTLGTTTVGPVEFRYSAGAGYEITPIIHVMAEGFGSTQFSGTKGTNTLEIDGNVRIIPLGSGLAINVGGGAGIVEGVGVPLARAMVGLTFSMEAGDQDADGINDNDDTCPAKPEDKDQFEDEDGCPEDDNDKDGVVDTKDKCPLKAEVINGFKDDDGCPDEVKDSDKDGIPDGSDKCPDQAGAVRTQEFYGCADTDSDGVADPKDKCPNAAEDTDGFEDTDGCPDPDNDNDGVPDESDECGEEPEIKNGFKDEDGCPDSVPDADKDGIPDNVDKCPTRAETFNGRDDEDGCPEAGPSLVDIKEEEIRILQRVEFETSSDKIKGATSFAVLDAVIGALKANPQIFLVEVAGHTDNSGDAKLNKDLSQKRADAVRKYMIDKGVAESRLRATGYGQEKPISDNNTAAGKQKNRRVEFNILHSTTKKPPAQPAPAPAQPAPAQPAPPPAPNP
ncbi:MAG: OmpA family protein [Myxococcales bacterium]|nr:OmpA family protein [Myxococcales bacterium]